MKKLIEKKYWLVFSLIVFLIFLVVIFASCNNQDSIKKNLKWWQNTIVYEVYPSSFQDTNGDGYGDLKGVTSRLDHLAELGVGAIWLTPVYASPMEDNGYDVSDYYKINPMYGTMEDMDELIAKAKEKNIKIVMDLVFNHTSNESNWFKESKSSKNNDKSDWYIWRDAGPNGEAPNNWRSVFGNSAWTWDDQRQQYYLHCFGDFQPDINWENPNVRSALYDVAKFWLDKGVGGFRFDAVAFIKKPTDFSSGPADGPDNLFDIQKVIVNNPGILDFLHEFKDKVQSGHDIFTVGEAVGVSNDELDQWVGKNGVFDMLFTFDLMNVVFEDSLDWYKTKDFSPKDVIKLLVELQKNSAGDRWAPIFLENHDGSRGVEHFLPGCSDYQNGAKALATIMYTLRGTPFVYEGEEIGMTNLNLDSIDKYNDIQTKNQYKTALDHGLSQSQALKCVQWLSRDNARSPLQWDMSTNAGFTMGTPWLPVNNNYLTVNLDSERKDSNSIYSWYIKLKELRNNNEVLINGDFEEINCGNDNVFCFSRTNGKDKAIIFVNLSGEVAKINQDIIPESDTLLINNYNETQNGQLLPYQALVYSNISR